MVTCLTAAFAEFPPDPMATYRVHHNGRYTVIANETLQDGGISLAAKGLLGLMLSFPDNWHFNERDLISRCSEGRHSVRSAIQELTDAGYIRRCQSRQEGGKFGSATFDVYERPVKNDTTVVRFSDDGFSDDGFSDDGFSDDGFSDDGKSDDISNTYSTNPLGGSSNEGIGQPTADAVPTPAVAVEVLEPETNPEPQPGTSASLTTQGKGLSAQPGSRVGTKSSAAPRRAKKAAIDVDRWMDTYNRHKPDKWSMCTVLNDKRQRAIAKAVDQVGEDKAIELLAAGLAHLRVSSDCAWWRDRAMTIDNTLADLRFIGWGEAGLSAGINPDAVANSGMTDAQIRDLSWLNIKTPWSA